MDEEKVNAPPVHGEQRRTKGAIARLLKISDRLSSAGNDRQECGLSRIGPGVESPRL